jgi:hypothetical protein
MRVQPKGADVGAAKASAGNQMAKNSSNLASRGASKPNSQPASRAASTNKLNWNVGMLDSVSLKAAKEKGRRVRAINQLVLDELLGFEQHCMPFLDEECFPDDAPAEEVKDNIILDSFAGNGGVATSAVLSKEMAPLQIEDNADPEESSTFLDTLRLTINAQMETPKQDKDIDELEFGEGNDKNVERKKRSAEPADPKEAVNEALLSIQQSYYYFLADLCQLFSIKECIVSMENSTRKEHYSMQQKIYKLNQQVEKFTKPGYDSKSLEGDTTKQGRVSGMFKAVVGKISGAPKQSEQEIYAEIKSCEKKLKTIDQLQTYQTVFICQVVIPNFNMRRRQMADNFIKGVVCKNYLTKLQKDIEMWQIIH